MSELLDNVGYAWAFIGGGVFSIDTRLFLAVLLVWTFAGLYHQYQHDPADVFADE